MKLAKRLAWCLDHGNLTVADLARWFGRPDPTVRGWVKGGTLGGPPHDRNQVVRQLDTLEKLIEARKTFPVPSMSQRKRSAYIESTRKKA